jgi:hypothetical protein
MPDFEFWTKVLALLVSAITLITALVTLRKVRAEKALGAAKTMIDRTELRLGLKPQRLAADSAYGSAPMLDWIVNEKKITPHVPVIDNRYVRAAPFRDETSRLTRNAMSAMSTSARWATF